MPRIPCIPFICLSFSNYCTFHSHKLQEDPQDVHDLVTESDSIAPLQFLLSSDRKIPLLSLGLLLTPFLVTFDHPVILSSATVLNPLFDTLRVMQLF